MTRLVLVTLGVVAVVSTARGSWGQRRTLRRLRSGGGRGAGLRRCVAHRASRRRRVDDGALCLLLDHWSGSVRSGVPLAEGLRSAAAEVGGPAAASAAQLAGDLERGQATSAALATWSKRHDSTAIPLVAGALRAALAAGGDPARALDTVATTLREREALRREVMAQSAQARLSALVVAASPIAFTVVLAVVEPAVLTFLASPLGLGCVVTGLGLEAIGAAWMVRVSGTVG